MTETTRKPRSRNMRKLYVAAVVVAEFTHVIKYVEKKKELPPARENQLNSSLPEWKEIAYFH